MATEYTEPPSSYWNKSWRGCR